MPFKYQGAFPFSCFLSFLREGWFWEMCRQKKWKIPYSASVSLLHRKLLCLPIPIKKVHVLVNFTKENYITAASENDKATILLMGSPSNSAHRLFQKRNINEEESKAKPWSARKQHPLPVSDLRKYLRHSHNWYKEARRASTSFELKIYSRP